MNSIITQGRSTFIKSISAIILMSVFFTFSCKKDEVTVSTAATVSGFSPSSGPVGTVVIITGTNFSSTLASNTVTFNGTPATVSAASAGQITATVPSGATTGKIAVTVAGSGGTATSSGNFTVN